MATHVAREFPFTARDFCVIRDVVIKRTGISLSDAKRDLVYARLAGRLRKLGLATFEEYLPLIEEDEGEEAESFVNAITTNITSFFRERHHFEYLADTILTECLDRTDSQNRIRIWSAGCSSGEEPYSLAITVRERIPSALAWDVKILATDLDTDVLATAERGAYACERLDGISQPQLKRWFWKGRGANADWVRLVPEIRELITFRKLNLMDEWPMHGPFDVIFCRNVLIYFDRSTQQRLFKRWARLLVPGGRIVLGHSETITGDGGDFEFCGSNVYRRVA